MPDDWNDTVHRSGSGEPVLLLHGITGSWHTWKPVIERLEPSYDVIAMTLPGHLGWPWPANRTMSLTVLADAVVERLGQLGVDRPHVVGNSLGGWLGLLLAARGDVRSVTAFSPGGGWGRDDEEEKERIRTLFRKMRATIGDAFPAAADFLADPETRRSILGIVMERGDLVPLDEAIRMWQAVLAVADLEKALAGMDTVLPELGPEPPQSIVWCGEDHLLPEVTCSDGWRAAAPHARWSVLEGAGHVPMYDDPEGVVRAIADTISVRVS